MLTFPAKLLAIAEILPAASAAVAEIRAWRVDTVGGRLYQLDHPGFDMSPSFPDDATQHTIARDTSFDKDRHPLVSGDASPFERRGFRAKLDLVSLAQ